MGDTIYLESPPEPEVAEVTDAGEPEWKLADTFLMNRLEDAEMIEALMAHIKKKQKLLISMGVKFGKGSDRPHLGKLIRDMPEKGFKMVVEEWIRQQVKGNLERYLSDEKHDLDSLAEHLSPLVLYWNKVVSKPDDLKNLAKLYLACYYDEKMVKVAKNLYHIKPDKKEKNDGFRENLIALIDDPGSEQSEKASQNALSLKILRLLASIRFGHWDVAKKLTNEIEQIENVSFDKAQLMNSIAEHVTEMKPQGSMPAKKMRMARTDEFQSIDGIEVLAQCTKHTVDDITGKPEYSFSKVLAVKKANALDWKEVSQEVAARLFPETASIVHFPGKEYPPLPQEGQFGVWKVEEQDGNNRSKDDSKQFTYMRASAKVMPAQQVRSFEKERSDDVEAVINKIAEVSHQSHASKHEVIRLADGLFIQAPEDMDEYLQSDHGDPVAAWKDIDVVQLNNGLNLHVGELPDTRRLYDMSSDQQIVKKALEQQLLLDSKHMARFTEVLDEIKEYQELTQSIKEMQLDALEWKSTDSGFGRLNQVLSQMDEIKGLMEERMKEALAKAEDSATFEEKIKTIKEQAKEVNKRRHEALANTDGLQAELDELIDRHFHKIRQLGRRLANTDRETRRSWFKGLDEAISEYGKEAQAAKEREEG